jgi:hypothetical protein
MKKKNLKKSFLIVRSYPRLLGEHVQNVSQKLIAQIRKKKYFSLVPCKERSRPFFAKEQVSYHNF